MRLQIIKHSERNFVMYYSDFVPKENVLTIIKEMAISHPEEVEKELKKLSILLLDNGILHHWKNDPDIVIDARIFLKNNQTEPFLRKSDVLNLIAQQENAAHTEVLGKAIDELPTISISGQAMEARMGTVTVTAHGKNYEHKQDYFWLLDDDKVAPAVVQDAKAGLIDSSHGG